MTKEQKEIVERLSAVSAKFINDNFGAPYAVEYLEMVKNWKEVNNVV